MAQYANIAITITPEEESGFVLYESAPEPESKGETQSAEAEMVAELVLVPLRSYALINIEAAAIHSEVQARVRTYGAPQGRIHAIASLKVKDAILRDLVQRKLEEMEVEKVTIRSVLSDTEFNALIGSQPQFTGKLTTQQFKD